MKYEVNIGYYTFFFYDRSEALDFAELAKVHSAKEDKIRVEISILDATPAKEEADD